MQVPHPPTFQEKKIGFNGTSRSLKLHNTRDFSKKNNNICVNSRKRVEASGKQVGDLKKRLEKKNPRVQSS
jgi:hypothetical protein